MKVKSWSFAAIVMLLATSGVAVDGSKPIAVSPGSAVGAATESTCPTFSWALVEGAVSYELAVYRLSAADRPVDEPIINEVIPRGALSWTPSLELCLGRGGHYAWSVRAVQADQSSEWAEPLLFEVVAKTSAEELAGALEVVRGYLAATSGDIDATTEPSNDARQHSVDDAWLEPRRQAQTTAGATVGLANAALEVEGEVRTVDSNDQPRLWGRGRGRVRVYPEAMSGANCVNTSNEIEFGLSSTVVPWGSAADTCPAGTWVCSESDLSGAPSCDTTRPDTGTDGYTCGGSAWDLPANDHVGWIADGSLSDAHGQAFKETGGVLPVASCASLPAWCCW